MVGREGVFAAAVRGITAAKAAGFQVCTNTTIYRDTDMHEIAVLFGYLDELGVDGLMISPAFGYASVCEGDPQGAAQIFMTREEVHEKFDAAGPLLARFRLTASPIYMEFLCGQRELACAAWANPTYNVRGWRGPCYLLGDAHYETYRELVDSTDWPGWVPAAIPAASTAWCIAVSSRPPCSLAHKGIRDVLRMAVWQMT